MCALNANLFREKDMDELVPAKNPKKVAVIGGGIAGMECARIAAKRGHDVTLYEQSSKLGGMFIAASVAKAKDAERRLLKWYEKEIKDSGVKVVFNTFADLSFVEQLDCDEIIVSTGTTPKLPPVKGIDGKNIYSPTKVLLGEEIIPEKSKVSVIGGGLVGCEVALWLKQENGFEDVTLIEGASDLMTGGLEKMPAPNKLMVEDMLKFYKVNVRLNTMLDSVEDGKVNVKTASGIESIDSDAVIVALGSAANDKLYREINENVSKKVWLLGDAKSPSNVMFGIRDANSIARSL